MNLKNSFAILITFFCFIFLFSCSNVNDIKRPVYFNFSLGSSLTELDNQWTVFRGKNNGNVYATHYTRDNITYYSSIDPRANKYDTIINFLSVFYFLNLTDYKGMVGANNMNSTLYLNGESVNQIESISSDILNDIKTKYGSPTDTSITSDPEYKVEKIIEYNWKNKNDLNIKFIRKTIYDENLMDPTYSRHLFSFRIIYEYTDEIKKKYFTKKSPY